MKNKEEFMDFFSVLTMAGGIALFLFGMNYMGDGLKKLSGGSLEAILQKLTANRFMGFFLGLFVTAAIQSSSAVMVMLVGFVNSGIMVLSQTSSVLLGANIGTTATAWLLSTSGISGSNFILRLLKPTSFTPILAVVGVTLKMFTKKDKTKDICNILIGFAILMFGMQTMSSATSGLQNSESFTHALVMFSNPIMGILVGTLFTAVLQSSSATVGILQALSLTTAIPMSTAVPIILGMNIGASVPPVLSAISGNTHAKRVAALCVYLKIIGVAIFASIFYLINAFMHFSFLDANASVFTIAMFHTAYNVAATIILFPLLKPIEHLAEITIKGDPEGEKKKDVFAGLDERFLQFPPFAIEKSRELVVQMANIAKQSFDGAICMAFSFDEKVAKKITKNENLVDRYEDKLTAYLIKLVGKRKSTFRESNEATTLTHIISDIERISDYSYDIVGTAREIDENQIEFSDTAKDEIDEISKVLSEMLGYAIEAIATKDKAAVMKIGPLKKETDELIFKTRSNHIERLQNNQCSIDAGFVFLDLLTDVGHISNHCSNIAVYFQQKEDTPLRLHKKKRKKAS